MRGTAAFHCSSGFSLSLGRGADRWLSSFVMMEFIYEMSTERGLNPIYPHMNHAFPLAASRDAERDSVEYCMKNQGICESVCGPHTKLIMLFYDQVIYVIST